MTTPTSKPIPSNDVIDLKFNAEKIDEVVNSASEKYTDRFGVERLTIEGIRRNLSALGKVYTQEQALAAIASGEIPNGAIFYIRSESDKSLADEYQNVDGVATPTGKSQPSNGAVVAVSEIAIINQAYISGITIPSALDKVSVEPGIYQLSTGIPFPSNAKEVRMLDFIYLDVGDVVSVGGNYNVAGVFYDHPSVASINGEYFTYSAAFTATKRAFVRLVFKYIGKDSYNPQEYSTFSGFKVIRKARLNVESVSNASIAPHKLIITPASVSSFPLTDGTINGGNGADAGHAATNVCRTGFIYVSKGDVLSITDSNFVFSAFYYRNDRTFISAGGSWHTEPLTCAVDGYVRLTTKMNSGAEFISTKPLATWLSVANTNPLITLSTQIRDGVVIESNLSPSLQAKINDGSGSGSVIANKTWLSVGDSITARGWYQPLVVALTGLASYVNYGVGGTTLARKSPSDTTAMCERVKNIADTQGDYITVWGGVNDFGYSYGAVGGTTLGVMGDTSLDTVYGAVDSIIKTLLTKYPKAKLAFVITTPVSNAMGMRSLNAKGKGLSDYCNAIKQVCEFYSIPYIDLYHTSNFNEININTMTSNIAETAPDGLHPSRVGMEMLSNKIAHFMSAL